MEKNEIKEQLVKMIAETRLVANPKRVETICRSQINRFSYEMILGDHCIYLERGDRKVFIESKCSDLGDGWSKPNYVRAFEEARKILDKMEAWYEETVCDHRQAV